MLVSNNDENEWDRYLKD